MRIAIAGAGGRVGRALSRELAEAGAELVLMDRDVSRIDVPGADIREGALESPHYVVACTENIDALFWITPGGIDLADPLEFMDTLGVNVSASIAGNEIPRIVNVSAAGAHIPTAAGFVEGLHDNEERMDDFAGNIVHLRPGFFMDDIAGRMGAMRETGQLRFPLLRGDRAMPMVAIADIAYAAAQLLLSDQWEGHHILGLHGPTDLTPDEAAAIASEVLDRSVSYVPQDEAEARAELERIGASQAGANLLLDLYRGLDDGSLAPAEERTERTTTPTTLHDVLTQAAGL